MRFGPFLGQHLWQLSGLARKHNKVGPRLIRFRYIAGPMEWKGGQVMPIMAKSTAPAPTAHIRISYPQIVQTTT